MRQPDDLALPAAPKYGTGRLSRYLPPSCLTVLGCQPTHRGFSALGRASAHSHPLHPFEPAAMAATSGLGTTGLESTTAGMGAGTYGEQQAGLSTAASGNWRRKLAGSVPVCCVNPTAVCLPP